MPLLPTPHHYSYLHCPKLIQLQCSPNTTFWLITVAVILSLGFADFLSSWTAQGSLLCEFLTSWTTDVTPAETGLYLIIHSVSATTSNLPKLYKQEGSLLPQAMAWPREFTQCLPQQQKAGAGGHCLQAEAHPRWWIPRHCAVIRFTFSMYILTLQLLGTFRHPGVSHTLPCFTVHLQFWQMTVSDCSSPASSPSAPCSLVPQDSTWGPWWEGEAVFASAGAPISLLWEMLLEALSGVASHQTIKKRPKDSQTPAVYTLSPACPLNNRPPPPWRCRHGCRGLPLGCPGHWRSLFHCVCC